MIMKLKDGGITDIQQDNWCESSGCETCNYGSSYITELNVYLTKMSLIIENDSMYEYGLSDGILMRIMLSSANEIQDMTEKDFCDWLVSKITEEGCEITHKIKLVK